MISVVTQRLLLLCDTVPDKISQVPDEEFERKPAFSKWSKKEIIGHLIDSAANNNQRFVRAQFQTSPVIYYDQNEWVNFQRYQSANRDVLLNLWENYNRHLAHVISSLPAEALKKHCVGRDGFSLDLAFLIKDYLAHLEHHLKQMVKW